MRKGDVWHLNLRSLSWQCQETQFPHPDRPSNLHIGKTMKGMQFLLNPSLGFLGMLAQQDNIYCWQLLNRVNTAQLPCQPCQPLHLSKLAWTSSISDRADNWARQPLKNARRVFLVSSATSAMLQHAVQQFLTICANMRSWIVISAAQSPPHC